MYTGRVLKRKMKKCPIYFGHFFVYEKKNNKERMIRAVWQKSGTV